MQTKMLELAEKLEHRSRCSDTEDFSEMYNMLAHDIRSIFTPRDWREGCVVEQANPNGWFVKSPDRLMYLNSNYSKWQSGTFYFATESSARTALASCPTPYPGYKENTCEKPSSSSTSTPTSSPSSSSGLPQQSGGDRTSATTTGESSHSAQPLSSPRRGTTPTTSSAPSDTLTFGGPALRVAFHFDGDMLVRWEILEQREELRGKVQLSRSVFSEGSPAIMYGGTTCVRGTIRSEDHTYPIFGTHTRATITALGREIDQVNREWCEKLGIGKDDTDTAKDDYIRVLQQEIATRAAEHDSLRRQLAAAEKVIDTYAGLSSSASAYRTTYPKNGGAQ